MSCRSIAVLLSACLILLVWLFIGVERFNREHGETEYEFFTKQSPGFTLVFENTARCGECDVRPWDLMHDDDRQYFAEYCAARFGLNEVRPCYAIFQEEQRMANERLGR